MNNPYDRTAIFKGLANLYHTIYLQIFQMLKISQNFKDIAIPLITIIQIKFLCYHHGHRYFCKIEI